MRVLLMGAVFCSSRWLHAQDRKPELVHLSSGIAAGHILTRQSPMLSTPEERIGGSVVLHVIIGVDGHVEDVSVVSGPPAKARATADAVKKWVYRPFVRDGRPVRVDTTVTSIICF